MKKCLLILLGLLLIVIPVSPVFAIADPDSPPQVSAVYVYEFDDDSIGVLIDYYLDYSTPFPDEIVTDAYLAAFIDTDGATQLKTVSPYTFQDSGYGRGLVWIKFTAAEVTTYAIDVANIALYEVWLMGNPTLAWAGDPPKTIVGIDQWNTAGDMEVLLALRVLYYADVLELIWSLDLIETTALGNRLTTVGGSYFENVIANLRTLAPNAFSTGSVEPTLEDIDYSTSFGAVVAGAIIAGTPVTLTEGTNVITATGTGDFTITLDDGTAGTITDLLGSITSSPSDIVAGINTITVTGAGTLTVEVDITSLQEVIDEGVEGSGFDLTTIAATFGMSRAMFSGALWILITVLICSAIYGGSKRLDRFGSMDNAGAGKVSRVVFGVCMIIGGLGGRLAALPAAWMFIAYGAFTGYVLFFKNSGGDIGKTVMFMGYMWVIVCLAGGIMTGVVPQASTRLTADITAADTTITVASTEGFKEPGIIVIGSERIAYYRLTATEFQGTFWRATVRGAGGTEAAVHVTGEIARMPESALINNSLDYNIALLSDASGLMSFVTVPLAIFNIITSFMFLPLAFLGTDLVIITVVWGIIALGLLVSIFISLAGGRRV